MFDICTDKYITCKWFDNEENNVSSVRLNYKTPTLQKDKLKAGICV